MYVNKFLFYFGVHIYKYTFMYTFNLNNFTMQNKLTEFQSTVSLSKTNEQTKS